MLKIGDTCMSGQKVGQILGQSEKVCCYFTIDKNIRWEYYDNGGHVPPEMMPAISIFDTCLKNIHASIPDDLKRPYYEHAAKSLFSALDVGDPEMIEEFFQDLRASLKAIRDAPVFYAIAGMVSSFFIISLFLLIKLKWGNEENTLYFFVSILGIAGGVLSVMQRSSRLWSSPDTSKTIIVLQGCSRTIIGGLFGLFSCLLVKGNLLVGFAANSDQSILALAFLAGMSERLIPEVSDNLERRITKKMDT